MVQVVLRFQVLFVFYIFFYFLLPEHTQRQEIEQHF